MFNRSKNIILFMFAGLVTLYCVYYFDLKIVNIDFTRRGSLIFGETNHEILNLTQTVSSILTDENNYSVASTFLNPNETSISSRIGGDIASRNATRDSSSSHVTADNFLYSTEDSISPSVITEDKAATEFKTILFWFDDSDFHCYFGVGEWIFRDNTCPFHNCVVTNNHTLVNVEDFDAIIFDMLEFRKYSANRRNEKMIKRDQDLPSRRNPNQRYIVYYFEPPQRVNVDWKSFDGFFNLTMTYRPDSDIFNPYGYFVPINETKRNFDFSIVTDWEMPNYNEQYLDRILLDIKNKSEIAEWLVSDCETPSERERYVSIMKKYINVDVYGKCGTLTCPGRMSDECYKMLEKKYKFYLSFENSLCKDYVTEKLFNIMRYNIVPIVYGAANYKIVAPPGSYINVYDFEGPEELSKYLKYLNENDEEYVKYFWWKRHYKVSRATYSAWCKLCEMLNKPNISEKSLKTSEWFDRKSVCYDPKWTLRKNKLV